jgi:hypothetical protein
MKKKAGLSKNKIINKKTKPHDGVRRLLDLLAGWTQFAAKDPFGQKELNDICKLYQMAAKFETKEDVIQFLENKVKPLILNGSKKTKV